MYEHHTEALLPLESFWHRVARHGLVGFSIILLSLLIGASGYHLLEGLPWIDATLNAAMILSGMGPVDTLVTRDGKLFATVYALYSGIVFIGVAGLLMAPFLHRLLHHLHARR